MSTPFKPIEIPPGVVALPTKKMRSSNWAEVNMLRWREGQLTPMGGQAQLSNVVNGVETYRFASRCKMIHGFYDLNGEYYIAYLCETNIYIDAGGTLYDITPVGGMTAPAGLVGGYGDDLYNVDTYGTPRSIPSSVAITKVPDAYSIDNFGAILYAMTSADSRLLMWDPSQGLPGVVSTASAYSPWGAAQDSIQMTTLNDGSVTPGMSVINQTSGLPLGTVASWDSPTLFLTANALNGGAANDVLAFGNFNVAAVQPADSGRGPVPLGRCFVVTQERFIMMFGTSQDGTVGGGSARRFAWCDQENPGAWDYSNVTSQAGFLDIEPASPIICAIETRVGILFWTGKKAYVSQFLGLPYIYNYLELSDNCTPWSPQSMCTTSSLTLWFSEQGVFSFDGTSIMPVPCKVRPWIDDDIDPVQVRELSFAAHLGEFNEWWWFFPTLNSPFNNQAAVYNYKEGWWTQVQMSRSAGITSSYTSHPIFADDFVAFQHEVGAAYANANMPVVLPYAESFDLNINFGTRLTTVKQLIPDVEAVGAAANSTVSNNAIANLLYSLFYRNSRSLGSPELQTIKVPVRTDGFVDLRATGRDIRLRLDVASAVIQPFTLGQHLIDAVPRGDR